MLMLKILNTTTTSASTTTNNSSLILSTTVVSVLLTADWSLLSTESAKKTMNYNNNNIPTKAVNLTTESTTTYFTTTQYTTTGWVAPSSTSTSTTTFKPLQKGRPEGSGKEISSKKLYALFISASSTHAGWKILQGYDCLGNDLTKGGYLVGKTGVQSIDVCISFCKQNPVSDAVTLVPEHNDFCYCKTKTCFNAMTVTTNMTSAYMDKIMQTTISSTSVKMSRPEGSGKEIKIVNV